jgi:hypothetical protein
MLQSARSWLSGGLAALLVGVFLGLAQPASAQSTPAQPRIAVGPSDMPIQEWQSLACLGGGALASFGLLAYNNVGVVAAAITGGNAGNPVLLLNILATGFALGCTVGNNLAPGLIWLYRQM